jgi:DNA repair exonuclease SbcCD ATPase subunit
MIITQLKASNIKKLKAVELDFDKDDNLVMITGKNAAGKTSVLDSIWYALGGKRNIPAHPIREGEDHAEISMILESPKGTYEIVRTFTEKDSYIKILNTDGSPFSNPNDFLEAIIGNLSFDPAAFSRMEGKKQVAELIRITGIDFTDLDGQKKDKTEERLLVGREMKSFPQVSEEVLTAAKTALDSEKEGVSLDGLLKAKAEIEAENRKYDSAQASIATTNEEISNIQNEIARMKGEITRLEGMAASQELAVKDLEKIPKPLPAALDQVNTDISDISKRSEEKYANQKIVNDWNGYEKKKQEYSDLTTSIEQLDAKKAADLAAAKMPIAGLGWDEEGVTFNGFPYNQLSTAEQLKVSMAIAMASNPKLKLILIRDGSLLDKDSLAVIKEMIQEQKDGGEDWQIFIESVDDSGKVGIYIEDGEVKAIN